MVKTVEPQDRKYPITISLKLININYLNSKTKNISQYIDGLIDGERI